jgi:hypothetical protein
VRSLVAALFMAALLTCLARASEPNEWWTQPIADGLFQTEPESIQDATPAPRLVASTDYLLWWLREGRIPAILTTSSQASQGVLGRPDTQILYGDDRLETRHGDQFNGIAIKLGYWFDDTQTLGIEGKAFFLERDSTHFIAVSDGSTLLARPYFNPDGSPASVIIAGQSPTGPRDGAFVGYSRIELFGQEANLVAPLVTGDTVRLEALAGARFLQMRDRTDLTATGHLLPDQATLFGMEDHYRTGNAYYGGQLGLRGEVASGRWSLELRGEVGLGGNDEQVRAYGFSVFQTPTERIVTPTGLTVQASNTGTFNRVAVNMVSEANFQLGYRLTRHIQLLAGYTMLLWDGPLRSGDQIDTVVNTHPGTSPAQPISFKEDLFWAQGVNAALAFSW